MQLTTETVRAAVAAALIEDQAADDVTTRWSVPEALEAEATMIAKQSGRVAGLTAVQEVYAAVDPTVTVRTAAATAAALLLRNGTALIISPNHKTAADAIGATPQKTEKGRHDDGCDKSIQAIH